ncbi:MAG: ISAzo13 family transposase, partial [Deltaproteobacteria bacterium]|nr:ISAzo13 family transposase [Deltaproteobacteria bacterium]
MNNLTNELKSQDFSVSDRRVRSMLHDSGYSLEGNMKVLNGARHPLRDEQFEYINAEAGRMLELGNPVLSADTRKGGAGEFRERRQGVDGQGGRRES